LNNVLKFIYSNWFALELISPTIDSIINIILIWLPTKHQNVRLILFHIFILCNLFKMFAYFFTCLWTITNWHEIIHYYHLIRFYFPIWFFTYFQSFLEFFKSIISIHCLITIYCLHFFLKFHGFELCFESYNINRRIINNENLRKLVTSFFFCFLNFRYGILFFRNFHWRRQTIIYHLIFIFFNLFYWLLILLNNDGLNSIIKQIITECHTFPIEFFLCFYFSQRDFECI